ncbi:MAG: DUF1819 family protein [Syntrophales bacterium]
MAPEAPYNMSFTAGGLWYRESVEFARLYLTLKDWQDVRRRALGDNLIQARTASTSVRICREICQRLAQLNLEELQILSDGSTQEQRQILWLAICRRHRFIYDFAVEVIREKYLHMSLDLTYEDYDVYFNAKAEWHDELEKLTVKTRSKIRQVLFRILRETDLLTKGNTINSAMLTQRVAKTVGKYCRDDLAIFPASEAEIRELLQ